MEKTSLINFSIPWIKNPLVLEKLIKKINNSSSNYSKIYEVFYRPEDLELSGWEKSLNTLKFARKREISLAMTTTRRSRIENFEKDFNSYLEKSHNLVPDRLIVDQDSIDVVANNNFVKKHKIKLYLSAIMGIKNEKDV